MALTYRLLSRNAGLIEGIVVSCLANLAFQVLGFEDLRRV